MSYLKLNKLIEKYGENAKIKDVIDEIEGLVTMAKKYYVVKVKRDFFEKE